MNTTTSNVPAYSPVVIIGAGPAGLAVGRELACHGVDNILLEGGRVPGDSFTRFPKNIFFGPWLNNRLPGSSVGWRWLLRRAQPSSYSYYLSEYARQNHLAVHTETRVLSVRREAQRFVIVTDRGTLESDLLVNATGYFNKPYTPDWPGLATTRIPTMHVCAYRCPETVRTLLKRNTGRVLIVGKRVSAGETMVELSNNGFQVDLSFRGKLRFAPSTTTEALLSPFNMVLEKLALILKLQPDSFPPMSGGASERLIASGRVQTHPDVQAFEENEVRFVDGSRKAYDLVIFATGYRCVLDHLRGLIGETAGDGEPALANMESTRVPGLFFVGLENQRTYRSRFLRGIARDAPIVARLVAERLRSLDLRPPEEPIAHVEDVRIDLEPTLQRVAF